MPVLQMCKVRPREVLGTCLGTKNFGKYGPERVSFLSQEACKQRCQELSGVRAGK